MGQGGGEWSGKPVPETVSSLTPLANKLIIDYICTPHIALLPLIAYGGGEASCEAEIEGLSKLYDLARRPMDEVVHHYTHLARVVAAGCVEFVAVVPHRDMQLL